jgi:hypothetical protein
MKPKGVGPQGLGGKDHNGFWIGNGGSSLPIKGMDNGEHKCSCGAGKGSPLHKTAAWTRKEGKDSKGGLNAKGVASYRKEHPGSKLQTAVTKKPSELKPGSKDANRRKSFCARMSGMPGALKKPNGEPTRKKLALDKWNC